MGDGGSSCRRACEALLTRLSEALVVGDANGGDAGGSAGQRRRLASADKGHGGSAAALLAAVRPVEPPRIDPFCENFCRKSFELLCQGGFEPALAAAVEAHASFLELPARRADALAVLVFVYGAGLDEWTATLEGWSTASFGFGADALLLGATWDQASTPKARPRARRRCVPMASPLCAANAAAAGGVAAAAEAAAEAVRLPWEPPRQRQWSRVLGACAAAMRSQPGKPDARCVLRTVAEQTRSQTHPQPYRDFEAHVAPLALAAGVPLVGQFEGTWAGARAGLLRHHDTTKIHFADNGRTFLAQLSLNALALALPRRAALPPPRRRAALHLPDLLHPVSSSGGGLSLK